MFIMYQCMLHNLCQMVKATMLLISIWLIVVFKSLLLLIQIYWNFSNKVVQSSFKLIYELIEKLKHIAFKYFLFFLFICIIIFLIIFILIQYIIAKIIIVVALNKMDLLEEKDINNKISKLKNAFGNFQLLC